jgi:hypothetical protein
MATPWPVQDATDRERKIGVYSTAGAQIEGDHLVDSKLKIHVPCLLRPGGNCIGVHP